MRPAATLFLSIFLCSFPADAYTDSKTKVHCQGPPPWSLFNFDRPPSISPEQLRLQDICANSDDGGITDFTVEGYCTAPEHGWDWMYGKPKVQFQVSYDVLSSNKTRLAQFCMKRCTCSGVNPTEQADQSLAVWPSSGKISNGWSSSKRLYNINFTDPTDVQVQPQNALDSPVVARISAFVSGGPFGEDIHATEPDSAALLVWRYYQASKKFGIRCDDQMPRFPLPNDADISGYTELQDVCATVFDGGNSNGNAGAYCRPLNDTHSDIDFADEVTLGPWSWDYGYWPYDPAKRPARAIQIRKHCWDHCSCPEKMLPNYGSRPLATLWPWLGGEPKAWIWELMAKNAKEAPAGG